MTEEQIAIRMAQLAYEKVYDRIKKSFQSRTLIVGDTLNVTYKLDIGVHVVKTEEGFEPVEKTS